jgi:hypothetical protein
VSQSLWVATGGCNWGFYLPVVGHALATKKEITDSLASVVAIWGSFALSQVDLKPRGNVLEMRALNSFASVVATGVLCAVAYALATEKEKGVLFA